MPRAAVAERRCRAVPAALLHRAASPTSLLPSSPLSPSPPPLPPPPTPLLPPFSSSVKGPRGLHRRQRPAARPRRRLPGGGHPRVHPERGRADPAHHQPPHRVHSPGACGAAVRARLRVCTVQQADEAGWNGARRRAGGQHGRPEAGHVPSTGHPVAHTHTGIEALSGRHSSSPVPPPHAACSNCCLSLPARLHHPSVHQQVWQLHPPALPNPPPTHTRPSPALCPALQLASFASALRLANLTSIPGEQVSGAPTGHIVGYHVVESDRAQGQRCCQ